MDAIVLAAGKGTRMRSDKPKVLHEVLGRPMIDLVLDALRSAGVMKPCVVIGSGAELVRAHLGGRVRCVEQTQQLGTGHAVMVAEKAFRNCSGDIVVMPGDMPLVRPETLKTLIREHRRTGADVSVLSSIRRDAFGYGRILRRGEDFVGIREELDATAEERRIGEVNTGVYVFRARALFDALKKVRPQNQKQEFYLTDTIEVIVAAGGNARAFALAAEEEGQGINRRADLAEASRLLNRREIDAHAERGVTFVAPDQTWVGPGVAIGRDTTIYPWSFIESGVKIGRRCEIGPCAKLRRGTVIGDDSTAGSFVEINRSRLGRRVTAKHLAYLGDAVVGDGTNIGAGVITANFDGKSKHATRLGREVLVGSNTVFVAPVTVGSRARTGAGAVVKAGTRIKTGQTMVGVPARPVNEHKKGK